MIFSIARKEFIDAWRDGRIRWAMAILVGLLGVASLLALQQVQRTRMSGPPPPRWNGRTG